MTGNGFKMIQVISKVKIVIDEKTCFFWCDYLRPGQQFTIFQSCQDRSSWVEPVLSRW